MATGTATGDDGRPGRVLILPGGPVVVRPALVAVWLLAVACGGDGGEPATGTAPATATATGTPAATATPPGQPALTAVAAAISEIEGGREAEVASRVRLSPIPCAAGAYPQPPCPAGAAEGSPMPRLPFVGCEATFLTADEATMVLRQVLAGRTPTLTAIATVPDATAGGLFPLAPFGAVFQTAPPAGITAPTGVLVILDAEGAIVSLRTGCRATPEQLFALLPAAKPIPDPRLGP